MAESTHASWVRVLHAGVSAAFLVLAFTGVAILMVYPRLHWGETGNDLTDAWLELPISRNLNHVGTRDVTPIFDGPNSPVSASVEYDMFNENGWARSLHFLAAWVLVICGLAYLALGVLTRHFGRHIVPSGATARALAGEIRDHLRFRVARATGGPDYGLLQRGAYAAVVFVMLPLMGLTGLAMSPALAASFPFLTAMFGGLQSARSVHFLAFVALSLFLFAHVLMIVLSGFGVQMLGIIFGIRRPVRPDDPQVVPDA